MNRDVEKGVEKSRRKREKNKEIKRKKRFEESEVSSDAAGWYLDVLKIPSEANKVFRARGLLLLRRTRPLLSKKLPFLDASRGFRSVFGQFSSQLVGSGFLDLHLLVFPSTNLFLALRREREAFGGNVSIRYRFVLRADRTPSRTVSPGRGILREERSRSFLSPFWQVRCAFVFVRVIKILV